MTRSSILVVGNPFMNFDNIPNELKALRQWVVWRSIITTDPKTGETRVTKPPFNCHAPQYPASVKDPSGWGTFEDAVQCLTKNPSLVSGIGFVFTDNDDFFGIDIDDEAKVKEEYLPVRKQIVGQLMKVDSYMELSPSGTGIHIISRGKLPGAGRRNTKLQLEVYCAQRFFTMTGNVIEGRRNITDQQELADEISKDWEIETASTELPGDIGGNRRLDLTDEEVLREASRMHPLFSARFNAQTDCDPGRWSEAFMAVIGVLDQVTGKVDQLERIVMTSPMVLNAPPSRAGESREAKARRNFAHVLQRVRGNNSAHLTAVAHGRALVEAMDRRRAEEARANAERILAQAEEAFSANGVHLLKAFPLDPNLLELNAPPGVLGELVVATMAACANPFLKFALPSTLATLSGILGRRYKLPGGSGLNLNFILAAPTSTGKTQTMDAWEGFLDRAARSIDNTIQGPSRNRIIKASATSIQGIFEDFMHAPAACWMISECHAQLQAMSNPKSTVDSQLRDAYNDLYDASKSASWFSPPRSVANRKAGFDPIRNLSISTYWTTTTEKLDVFGGDAQDGFLSRVVMIRHSGPAGDAVPDWEINKRLPDHLHDALVALMAGAKDLDDAWQMSPQIGEQKLITVSDEMVKGQAWAYRQIAERIKNSALAGDLPIAYVAVARLPMSSLRLAALLAVLESPYAPSISKENYEWAFSYLLQNMAALLSDLDTGQLGADMSADVQVVVREMKKRLRKTKQPFVHKGELTKYLKFLKPFKGAMPSPGEAVRRTIREMIENDQLVEIQLPIEGPGRPAKAYSPTSDEIWR